MNKEGEDMVVAEVAATMSSVAVMSSVAEVNHLKTVSVLVPAETVRPAEEEEVSLVTVVVQVAMGLVASLALSMPSALLQASMQHS